MSNLPEPNQEAASLANEEVAAARRDIETQLADGSLTTVDVFQMSEAEATAGGHRIVGHMHVRAMLLALPGIGETRADEILAAVGIEGDRHVDTLGVDEQEEIASEVEARQPGGGE